MNRERFDVKIQRSSFHNPDITRTGECTLLIDPAANSAKVSEKGYSDVILKGKRDTILRAFSIDPKCRGIKC